MHNMQIHAYLNNNSQDYDSVLLYELNYKLYKGYSAKYFNWVYIWK